MSKTDNPEDHEHSDYVLTPSLSFLFLFVLLVGLTMALDCRLDDLEDRMDRTQCEAAEDEAACLRALLEDK